MTVLEVSAAQRAAAVPDASEQSHGVDRIGAVAGVVWHALNRNGPTSPAQLTKQIAAPRDVVMQAIGWLAREGKLEIEEKGRRKTVALRPG